MKFDLFELAGQVAVVTGCNTGLGQAMAVALAEAGADIVGINKSAPVDTCRAVEALGRRFLDLRADLADIAVIPRLIAEAQTLTGHVDILVNNAGIIRREDALHFRVSDWDEVMAVNLKAAFFLAQALARLCIEQGRGGKIINVASMLSFQGGIRVPSYTASKSGVMGLTKALANEWAAHGINVNAIAPGYMATNNTAALQADEARNAAITARIPAGRWGKPADMAGPVVFLASQSSNYVNGYTLAVDGGWLAR
ncbi:MULTISPECIES: 2-dehydro-3-deoxy-D-gluconate 5-dehydrogenase KduD [unclassified Roseateles]|uniref:2-dehydro-3-deoxy-D-gluconate 5-dehydrogenase KduD n=1 Tax=unclassified Roseateles TaxID=2626991 RepID=UPI0006F42A10|nr:MULTISPECIES: 2-dehydro-3-deoxy-D-gluconate 5-dehydrogenase KduD [unclassified Roseateles]KQW52155.1 2-deoxy-D-gluconate 3-dehydrogenase [Pelomonas sp. Root405]KRA78389.1 2-deoxy-D-gluconate 3-dehydrogenase [Pelomonas sp. Root662]